MSGPRSHVRIGRRVRIGTVLVAVAGIVLAGMTATVTPASAATTPNPHAGLHIVQASITLQLAYPSATFNPGYGYIYIDSAGDVTSDISVPDTTVTYQLYGFLQLTAHEHLTVGHISGGSITPAGDVSVTVPIRLQLTSLNVAGYGEFVPAGSTCQMVAPVGVKESGHDDNGSVTLTGTATLGAFDGCGAQAEPVVNYYASQPIEIDMHTQSYI